MADTQFTRDLHGNTIFRHACQGKFPVEISIEHKPQATPGSSLIGGSLVVWIKGQDWEERITLQECLQSSQPQIGKLTGVQLRGLAALDQLEAMLQHECLEVIRMFATENNLQLTNRLVDSRDSTITLTTFVRSFKAMALFCYRELIDRGRMAPHSGTGSPPTDQELDNDLNSNSDPDNS